MVTRSDAAALLSVASSLENAAGLLRSVLQPSNDQPAPAPTPASLPLPLCKRVVVSLFDYTCIGLEPWRTRGFEVHAYDIRHPPGHTTTAAGIHLHTASTSAPMRRSPA